MIALPIFALIAVSIILSAIFLILLIVKRKSAYLKLLIVFLLIILLSFQLLSWLAYSERKNISYNQFKKENYAKVFFMPEDSTNINIGRRYSPDYIHVYVEATVNAPNIKTIMDNNLAIAGNKPADLVSLKNVNTRIIEHEINIFDPPKWWININDFTENIVSSWDKGHRGIGVFYNSKTNKLKMFYWTGDPKLEF